MKQREFTNCINCGRGMAACGVHFYRVRIEQHVLDVAAIRRQAGLELMLGGAAALAEVMGPDEDLAVGLGDVTALVCADCAWRLPVAALWEPAEAQPA